MLCGESYGTDTLCQLAPHMMNVYIQNHQLDQEGPVSLPTFCRGEVRFHHLPIWESGGIDTSKVFSGLHEIEWEGHFTIHQAEGIETIDEARSYALRCAKFVRGNEV
jgi:sugar phosphate isomerase/epimerase